MSFSLELYQSQKQQISNQLTQLSFVLKEIKQTHGVKQVQTLQNLLAKEQFQLVVVGEFSRGKSTFINALLGKKLLPASAKPTTTILNTISYSEESTITLHYHDESKPKRQISEQEFAELVAPREPIPGDKASEIEYEEIIQYLKSIKLAEIGHPLPFSKEGVTIIDTPGVNDLDEAREQITNNIIPGADAAIMLLSAAKILSDSEMSFLRDRILASDIQKIFIVINFKDDLKSVEDQNKVINTALTRLEPVLPNVKLHLVSAKQALNAKRKANGEILMSRGRPLPVWDFKDTGFVELESALADFLQNERGAVKLKKPIQRALKLIEKTINEHLQFEKNSLTKSIDDLHEKVASFRVQLQQIRKTGKVALKILDFELSKEGDRIQSWYTGELSLISSAGLQAFDENRYKANSADLPNIVETTIAPLEREIHMEKSSKVEKSLQFTIEKASKKLNDEWSRLDQQFQQMFNPTGSETGLSLTNIDLPQMTPSAGMIFFEDLLGELADAWFESTTLLGKALSGAGIAITAIAYGVFEIGRSFLSWLFGEDKTTKLRNEVNNRLQSSKQNKMNTFKKEWRDLSKAVKQQYELMIEKQIEQKEQQLQLLTENTQLQESELSEKLYWIEQREQKLTEIHQELLKSQSKLLTRHEMIEV